MDPPKEPSKPGTDEADAALAASAANAVEQWRTYQNAYTLYQQQQAAYENYMQKQATLTSYEEKQAAYQQYLQVHNNYQAQLEHYESNKSYQEYYAMTNGIPVAAPVVYPATAMTYQPPPNTAPPVFTTPLANVDPFYNKAKDHYRDPKHLKRRSEGFEKRTKVYTTTNYYANPDDEALFPADLKKLFKDMECNLCICKMNSHISANVHYQSKVHERKVNQWLNDWCEQTGTPKVIRPKRKQLDVEPVGANSLRCEACDLPLTSIQHANQHYTGKRHAMVIRGKRNPAGKGFYGRDGSWTRTATGAPDANPERFGIGQTFASNKDRYSAGDVKRMKLQPPPSPPKELLGEPSPFGSATPLFEMPPTPVYNDPTATPTYTEPATPVYGAPATPVYSAPAPVVAPIFSQPPPLMSQPPPTLPRAAAATIVANPPPQSTVESEIKRKESADCVDATGVFCMVCQIGVTSKTVMETHLKGAKHLKKLRLTGRMPPPDGAGNGTVGESILESLHKPPQKNDWSLYRLTSGKYYCKTCNTVIADEKLFSQHWYGRKHKLKAKQEEEQNGGGSTTTTTTTADKKPKFFHKRPFGKNRFVQQPAQ